MILFLLRVYLGAGLGNLAGLTLVSATRLFLQDDLIG